MLPVRKPMRLPGWDYSQYGCYFLTICIKNRKPILSKIVGRGILDAPEIRFSDHGQSVQQTIEYLQANNLDISIHNWVVMPNHLHILLSIVADRSGVIGASGMPRPTNAVIPKLVSSLKRFTNQKAGFDLWQTGYYDHIIRDDEDFIRRWRYIDNNPAVWLDDEYYSEMG